MGNLGAKIHPPKGLLGELQALSNVCIQCRLCAANCPLAALFMLLKHGQGIEVKLILDNVVATQVFFRTLAAKAVPTWE
ncbi:MAG: hypothetical protein CYG59_06250 [Chloroflexi bacterium]|nr:MAG: hypothetical protein CYG59_06250 [Chloroflexota bacterium]